MSVGIKRSYVPRIALEKTIRRGVELWQLANDNVPCPPHIVIQIRDETIRIANRLNKEKEFNDDETGSS